MGVQPVCCRGSEVADLLFVDVDVVQRVASCESCLQIEFFKAVQMTVVRDAPNCFCFPSPESHRCR